MHEKPKGPKHQLTERCAVAMLFDCEVTTIRKILHEVDELHDECDRLRKENAEYKRRSDEYGASLHERKP